MKTYWCIPPKQDADFIAHMEDVIDVYERPYCKEFPVICLDEKPYQLLGDVRSPLPMRPGQNLKEDAEYERNGTCSIFAVIEPLTGRQHISVRERRTALDWAEEIQYICDVMYPKAKTIVVVMDNLNTHAKSSLYKRFKPQEAHRLARRLEIHYTPKHGSWLDIAEIELSALARQCIGKNRIPDLEALRNLLKPWYTDRNQKQRGVDWHFTTEEARGKLKRLYPIINI